MGIEQFHYGMEDSRKKSFVAVRMEASLFKALKEKAVSEDKDLSTKIRELCQVGLAE